MSTKSTNKFGQDAASGVVYHLYEDFFARDGVLFLALDNVRFQIDTLDTSQVTIELPAAVAVALGMVQVGEK